MITPDTTIVLATRNKGKVAEFASLLTPFGLTVVGMDAFPDIAEVEETGTTFAENALLKASTVSRLSGLVAVADDSGLEVDALGKAPGVYSARYSATPLAPATDARNIEKLLEQAEQIARDKGYAVIVSDPKPIAVLALNKWIESFSPQLSYEEMKERNITEIAKPFALVPLSNLVVEE